MPDSDKYLEDDQQITGIPDFEEQDESITDIALDENKTKRFFKRLWHGKNKVGKYVGLGLDVMESFLPKWVSRIRDIIQSQTKRKVMLQGKKWYKSKTIWSAILIVVLAVLQALGVDLSADPELTATIFEVAMLLAGAFGLVGLRDAIDKQKDRVTS